MSTLIELRDCTTQAMLGPGKQPTLFPQLLRFLNKLEDYGLNTARWELSGISDPFKPVGGPISVATNGASGSLGSAVGKALEHVGDILAGGNCKLFYVERL